MRTRSGWVVARGAWLLGVAIVLSACAEKVTAPPEPPVSVRRGDRAFRDEKYGESVQAYRDYLVGHTASDPYTARVIYKTALAEYRLGQYANTLATLRELDELYPARRWVQVEALRGDAEVGLKNPVAAMQAWDIAWSVPGTQDRPKLRVRVERLEATMTSEQLAEARQSVASDELAAMLDRQIAQAPAALAPVAPPPLAAGAPPTAEEHAAIVMAEPPPTAEPEEIVMAEPPPARLRAPEPEPTVEIEAAPEAPPPVPPPAEEAAAPPIEVTGSDELARETEPAERVAEPEHTAEPEPAVEPEPPAVGRAEAAVESPETAEAEAIVPEEPSPAPTPPVELYGHEVVLAETPRPGRVATPAAEETAPRAVEETMLLATDIRVACLLPLSGPHKASGQGALRGIRLVFGEDDATLVLKDTGSVAADAGRLYAAIARDPSVIAVIGPTDVTEAAAVASQAERVGLPTLLLTAGRARPFVMPLGADESEETLQLLAYAVGPMRLRRFGVLYPRDRSGSARAAAFGSAVSRRGGSIVGSVAYIPGQLASMANYDTVRVWRDRRDVQALYVPDSSAGVARFAQFLESTVPDVTLLGVSGWDRLAAESALPGVSGVLFADRFFAGSARPATRDFVTRFEQHYGSTPETLEAEGFDAAMLARVALETGARTRGGFIQAVRAVPAGRTASGDYQFTPRGVERSLFLLQVSDGTVREVGATAPPVVGPVASRAAVDAE